MKDYLNYVFMSASGFAAIVIAIYQSKNSRENIKDLYKENKEIREDLSHIRENKASVEALNRIEEKFARELNQLEKQVERNHKSVTEQIEQVRKEVHASAISNATSNGNMNAKLDTIITKIKG